MVVLAQGKESEVPVGYSVPIGSGIVGSVAATGEFLNIEDVYQDARFSTVLDRQIGYRTRSML
jgi:hypothetical protein